jgi:hypothetical protein
MYVPRAYGEVVKRQGTFFSTSGSEIIVGGCIVKETQSQSSLTLVSTTKAHYPAHRPHPRGCAKHANRCRCQTTVKSIE